MFFLTICMYKHCFLTPCCVFFITKYNVVFKCIALGLIILIVARFLYLCTCFTCSSVLYMPQLFTHCLPTIIYVMLMSIVFPSFLLFYVFLTLLLIS